MFIDNSFLTEEELLNDNTLNEALDDLNEMSNLCFDYQNYLAENAIIYVQLEGRAYLNEDHYLLSELNAGFVKKIKDGIKLFLSKFKGFLSTICEKIREAARKIANTIRGKFNQFTAWLKKVKIINKKNVSESFDDYEMFNGLIVSERKPILYKSERFGGTSDSHYEAMTRKDVIMSLDLSEFEAVQTDYADLWRVLKKASPDLIKADNIDQLEEILITAEKELKQRMKSQAKGSADVKQIILDTVKNVTKIETDTKKAETDVKKAVEKAEKKVESEATKTSSTSSPSSTSSGKKSGGGGSSSSGGGESGGGFFSTIGKYIGKFFGFIRDIFMSIINGIRGAWRAIVSFFKGDKKEESSDSDEKEKKGNSGGKKSNKGEKTSDAGDEKESSSTEEEKKSSKEFEGSEIVDKKESKVATRTLNDKKQEIRREIDSILSSGDRKAILKNEALYRALADAVIADPSGRMVDELDAKIMKVAKIANNDAGEKLIDAMMIKLEKTLLAKLKGEPDPNESEEYKKNFEEMKRRTKTAIKTSTLFN